FFVTSTRPPVASTRNERSHRRQTCRRPSRSQRTAPPAPQDGQSMDRVTPTAAGVGFFGAGGSGRRRDRFGISSVRGSAGASSSCFGSFSGRPRGGAASRAAWRVACEVRRLASVGLKTRPTLRDLGSEVVNLLPANSKRRSGQNSEQADHEP